VTVARPFLRRGPDQLSKMSILPVDIAPLVDRVIDLEKRVGLAAHASVTEKTSDNDRVLHFRQTSHGITQLTMRIGPHPGVGSTVISRYVDGISAGPPQTF